MEISKNSHEAPNNLAVVLYFLFKALPIPVEALAIYLGHDLFVLGVTGEASIAIDAKDISGQMINAAPGLFFAVGGILALIITIIKGVNLKLNDGGVTAAVNMRADADPAEIKISD